MSRHLFDMLIFSLYSHDLERAVGCVEKLELFDGALGNRINSRATPAPLHQTDGLCCKHTEHLQKKCIKTKDNEAQLFGMF